MTTPQDDPRRALYRWWARVGYLVFATGSLSGIWLAWRASEPKSNENPLAVLVLVWVIAGVTHIFVRQFWRACVFSASGSVLGYVVLAVALTPNPLQNEMFGAGIVEVGLLGFFVSMLMGLPVVVYRHSEAHGFLPSFPLPTVAGTIGIIFGVVGILASVEYFARPSSLKGEKQMLRQMEITQVLQNSGESERAVRERLSVPPWFKQYCLVVGAAGLTASVLYLWGCVRLLRLRERGATLFIVGASAYVLVGVSIATCGLVSSSWQIRQDRSMALGSVVTNAVLLFFVWRWGHHTARAQRE